MPYELKIRDVFVVLVVHGQKGQLIVQGSSRYKGISDIRVMAENILLYNGAENIGDILVYRENNILF